RRLTARLWFVHAPSRPYPRGQHRGRLFMAHALRGFFPLLNRGGIGDRLLLRLPLFPDRWWRRMDFRSIASARIRRIANPGLSNSYRAEASEASVIPIAAQAAHERLLYVGKRHAKFLWDKTRFRESNLGSRTFAGRSFRTAPEPRSRRLA